MGYHGAMNDDPRGPCARNAPDQCILRDAEVDPCPLKEEGECRLPEQVGTAGGTGRWQPDAQAMLEAFDEPAILIGLDYVIVAANGAYQRLYGDAPIDRGQRCFEVSHHYNVPCDQAGEACPLRESLRSGRRHRVLHVHHGPEGQEHVDVETWPVPGPDGQVQFFIEVLRRLPVASAQANGGELTGRSRAFNRMLGLITRAAPSDASVLLQGETGTGKELVARAVHRASLRQEAPFVPVDCSGLTETLFESELFGHEKGSFTGAVSSRIGLVEAASGGTLFLDEVGDIPLALQVKLLRLLETRSFRRVGSVEPRRADFRLVAATHRDLRRMVEQGQFREDLYYRISTFPIDVPPLRARLDDLPLLCQAILRRLQYGQGRYLSDEALAELQGYDFPGNVRELRNVLERASLLADGPEILPEHLSPEVRGRQGLAVLPEDELLSLEEAEAHYLGRALALHQGDRASLARLLGVSERTLYRKLRRHGLG